MRCLPSPHFGPNVYTAPVGDDEGSVLSNETDRMNNRAQTQSSLRPVTVEAWKAWASEPRDDWTAAEEPLEIRLAGISLAVTMRTPGDDFDLVAGFLITEGVVPSWSDVTSLQYCGDTNGPDAENVVNANVRAAHLVDPERWKRNFYASSSCGICGKATIDAVRSEAPALLTKCTVGIDVLYGLGPALRAKQATFERTGGLHAAALFDADGTMLCLREDIGRHNAVDKAIGSMVRRGASLSESILMVSGRASFEIVQKALMAQIPTVAAVSAPSSLAVDLARASNMVLVGFLRSGEETPRCNVYAGNERVVEGRSPASAS